MSTTKAPKQIDPAKAKIEKCPKGHGKYVRHRWRTIKHGDMISGVIINEIECENCKALSTTTLDYNVLRDFK